MAAVGSSLARTTKEAVENGVPMVVLQQASTENGVPIGEKKITQFIEFELIKVVSRLNMNPNLSLQAHQIKEIAELIYEHFKCESLDDLSIAFKKGSNGFYGELYRLDGAVIVRWVQMYLDEKYSFVESLETKQKKEHSSDERKIDYRAFQERLENERAKAAENRIKEADEVRKQSDIYIKQQEYIGGRQKFTSDGMEVWALNQQQADKMVSDFRKQREKDRNPSGEAATPEKQ